MKKNNSDRFYSLFKIILIVSAMFILLTWFVNVTSNSGEVVHSQLGVMEMALGYLHTFLIFPMPILFILFTGGFYGVVSKTAFYEKLVSKTSELFKKRKNIFVILVAFILALLASSVISIVYLIVFIPFIYSVLNRLKLNKYVAFSCTFGAIMLGMVGPMFTGYGFDDMFTISEFDPANYLVYSGVILLLGFILLSAFMIMKGKNKKDEVEEIFEIEEVKEKVNIYPSVIFVGIVLSVLVSFIVSLFSNINSFYILIVSFFLIIISSVLITNKKKNALNFLVYVVLAIIIFMFTLGFINWSSIYNFSIVEKFYEFMTDNLYINTIYGSKPLIDSVLGASNIFGSWDLFDGAFLLLIASLVFGYSYKMKTKELFKNFAYGMKVMLIPAILFAFCSVINIYSSWIPMINPFVDMIGGLNLGTDVINGVATGFVGAFFMNDPAFFAHSVSSLLVNNYGDNVTSVMFVVNTMFAFAQFLLPTSILLFMGLYISDIKYKEWFKYIFKFLIGLFMVVCLMFFFV